MRKIENKLWFNALVFVVLLAGLLGLVKLNTHAKGCCSDNVCVEQRHHVR